MASTFSSVTSQSGTKRGHSSIISVPTEKADFAYGQIDVPPPQDIPRGAAAQSLNWITNNGQIEIRQGRTLIGSAFLPGNGKILEIVTGHRWDGSEVLFMARGVDLYWFNEATQLFSQILDLQTGGSVLVGITSEDVVTMVEYQSPSGNQLWVSSKNTGLFKIIIGTPQYAMNIYKYLFQESLTYLRGRIKISNGDRMLVWNTDKSKNFLFGSHVDQARYTDVQGFVFSAVSGQLYTGFLGNAIIPNTFFRLTFAAPIATPVGISSLVLGTQTTVITSTADGLSLGDFVIFSGVGGTTQINNLVGEVIGISSPTQFTVAINSTSFSAYTSGGTIARAEVFQDDYLGNLNSNFGGVGTVDYTQGRVTMTFNQPLSFGGNVVASYFSENSTDGGIADFSYTSAGRLPTEGFALFQGTGSEIQALLNYNGTEYCMHTKQTWIFSMPNDDGNNITNQIYRENVGILNYHGAYATGDGIYYIDVIYQTYPVFRLLQIADTNTEVIPKDLSSTKIDLSLYNFDTAVIQSYSKYVCFFGKQGDSLASDRMWLYDPQQESYDPTTYFASCACVYKGLLTVGNESNANCFSLFSSYSDNDTQVQNFWEGSIDNLNFDQLKKVKKWQFEGFITLSQFIDVYASLDYGPWSHIGTIYGNGSYVVYGNPSGITNGPVGHNIVGTTSVGDEGGPHQPGWQEVGYYEVEFKPGFEKFQNRQLRFVAGGIGFCSVTKINDYDVRYKTTKLPQKFRTPPIF